MQDHRLTLLEVVSLRKPSLEERREVWLERKKESPRPAKIRSLMGIVACLLATGYLYQHGARWQHIAGLLPIAFAGFLARGFLVSGIPKSEFMDGYDEGVRAGVNRVLQITREEEALIEELHSQGSQAASFEGWAWPAGSFGNLGEVIRLKSPSQLH